MRVDVNYVVAMAEFRFGCNNIFEDIIAGQQSWHLKDFRLEPGFDYFPFPAELKDILHTKKDDIQTMLDNYANKFCAHMNNMYTDIKFKSVHLEGLERSHSAVICYQLLGDKFKAQSMFCWYITESLDLDGYLESEIEKNFPFTGGNI